MNGLVRKGAALSGVAARHALAAIVTVLLTTVGGTVLYLLLVLISIVFAGDPGGPLNFVLVPLILLTGTTILCALLLLPVTVFTEWLCNRKLGVSFLVQIPVACLVTAVALTIWLFAWGETSPFSGGEFLIQTGLLCAAVAVPLGIYWWSLQAGRLILEALNVCFRFAARAVHSA